MLDLTALPTIGREAADEVLADLVRHPYTTSADAGAVAACAAYVEREWPEARYVVRIVGACRAVALLHVTATDGSRFGVVGDRWGQAWQVPEDRSARDALVACHAEAVRL